MYQKMILRLFIPTIALLAASLAAYCFFGIFIPHQFADVSMLTEVVRLSSNIASISAPALIVASAVVALYTTWRLQRWQTGLEDICRYCGGMVRERSGRYGRYQHCLSCEKNTKL
jgi:hypothetical protein